MIYFLPTVKKKDLKKIALSCKKTVRLMENLQLSIQVFTLGKSNYT